MPDDPTVSPSPNVAHSHAFRRPRKRLPRAEETAWACKVLGDLVSRSINVIRLLWPRSANESFLLFEDWESAYAWLREDEKKRVDDMTAYRERTGNPMPQMRTVRILAADGRYIEGLTVLEEVATEVEAIGDVTGWDTPAILWHTFTGNIPIIPWQLQTRVSDAVRLGYFDVRFWLWSATPTVALDMARRLRKAILPSVKKFRRGRVIGPSNVGAPYGVWRLRARQGRLASVMREHGEPPVDRRVETQAVYWRRIAKEYKRRFRDEQRVTADGLRMRYARLRAIELAGFRDLSRS